MPTKGTSIKNKFFFFKGTRHDCEEEYIEFEEIDKGVVGDNHGIIKLNKSKNEVSFDSKLELRVLLDLDECGFIKEIKTQSLKVSFPAKFGPKTKTYIPDIQLLLKEGSIVIIEVKPFKEMINSTVLRKSKKLRQYCKEHNYGYAIIDRDKNGKYYSFEDLKNENVNKDIQDKFIEFVKEKGEVTFTGCKIFKDEYSVNDYQICHTIWNNKNSLKYQQHKIVFKKKKHI